MSGGLLPLSRGLFSAVRPDSTVHSMLILWWRCSTATIEWVGVDRTRTDAVVSGGRGGEDGAVAVGEEVVQRRQTAQGRAAHNDTARPTQKATVRREVRDLEARAEKLIGSLLTGGRAGCGVAIKNGGCGEEWRWLRAVRQGSVAGKITGCRSAWRCVVELMAVCAHLIYSDLTPGAISKSCRSRRHASAPLISS